MKKGSEKDRKFSVILEDLRSQFRVFGEGLTALREKVDAIFEMTGKSAEDITFIKVDIRIIKNNLKAFDKRISALEESITHK